MELAVRRLEYVFHNLYSVNCFYLHHFLYYSNQKNRK